MPALDRRDLEDLLVSINEDACSPRDFTSVCWPQSDSDERVGVQRVIRPLPDQCSMAARFHAEMHPGESASA